MPKISVIIPTFNRCDLLRQAVASVLGQTEQDSEILVVADGSIDATAAFMASFAIAKVRYFRFPENRGGNAARNEGIRNATGEYLAFLDDDDLWEPNKLELQLKALAVSGADLCWTRVGLYRADGSLRRFAYYPHPFSNQHRAIMNDNFIGGTSSVVVRRAPVLSAGCFDEALPALQDWDLYIRLLKNGCRAEGVDVPLVRYVMVDPARSISCDFQRYKTAAALLRKKFGDDPYYHLLDRRLKIIEVKRMVKLKRFFFDAFRHYCGFPARVRQ